MLMFSCDTYTWNIMKPVPSPLISLATIPLYAMIPDIHATVYNLIEIARQFLLVNTETLTTATKATHALVRPYVTDTGTRRRGPLIAISSCQSQSSKQILSLSWSRLHALHVSEVALSRMVVVPYVSFPRAFALLLLLK